MPAARRSTPSRVYIVDAPGMCRPAGRRESVALLTSLGRAGCLPAHLGEEKGEASGECPWRYALSWVWLGHQALCSLTDRDEGVPASEAAGQAQTQGALSMAQGCENMRMLMKDISNVSLTQRTHECPGGALSKDECTERMLGGCACASGVSKAACSPWMCRNTISGDQETGRAGQCDRKGRGKASYRRKPRQL
jgi:hypothetical protein